ncbi:fructose-1,6-bisphosphatase/inositol monophosphatase family enzyme [Plantactinospora soyae]|uniref:Fructose-1,6-bisphosphatase/inositol monophosphatase family enzyme n=2 Tax=Plantactinospora soyae TaxID=1544732 RepID=A0A927QV48_9ACTN|nr:fructose-1,6-bisphosphatase/inositol monophosphatase family enzyme [Plantactinospora soyae]
MVDPSLVDGVGALMRRTAADAILPMFQRLNDSDVTEKAPGEVVTVADRRAEELLDAGLRRLLPDSEVVGEEGVAADPTVLERLGGSAQVWLVDPLDGTANFAAGRQPFAVMVALRRAGVTELSWILDPIADTLMLAGVGAGAYRDGVAVRSAAESIAVERLRGVVPTRFLPPDLRETILAGAPRIGKILPGQHCAGREYPDIVAGRQHFAIFWRTLPWDHAPGALLVEEAGGVVRRLDGSAYDPADDRAGLLVAANEQIWDAVHTALLSPR